MRFSEFIAVGIHDLFKTGIIRAILARGVSESTAAAVIGLGFGLCIIIPYLLGSIHTALSVSKLFFPDDVRK